MNSVVILDGDDAVMIDFGLKVQAPNGGEALESDDGAEDHGELTTREGKQCPDTSRLEGKNIRMVCITHVHTDHVGGLPILYKHYPNITVMTDQLNVRTIQRFFAKEKINSLPRFICDSVAQVGNFRITKFPVNHTVEGACGFKVEFYAMKRLCGALYTLEILSRGYLIQTKRRA
jgi:mRNA degradation ribonuclease J1/J2